MIIKVNYEDNNSDVEISENSTVSDVLLKQDIPIEAVVIKKNGETVTEDEPVDNGDKLEVIRVIYGG